MGFRTVVEFCLLARFKFMGSKRSERCFNRADDVGLKWATPDHIPNRANSNLPILSDTIIF